MGECLGFGEYSPLQVAEKQVGLRVAQHLEHGAVYLQKISGGSAAADCVGKVFDQGAIAVFGNTQRSLGNKLLGALHGNANYSDYAAGGIAERLDSGLQLAAVDLGFERACPSASGADVSVKG